MADNKSKGVALRLLKRRTVPHGVGKCIVCEVTGDLLRAETNWGLLLICAACAVTAKANSEAHDELRSRWNSENKKAPRKEVKQVGPVSKAWKQWRKRMRKKKANAAPLVLSGGAFETNRRKH